MNMNEKQLESLSYDENNEDEIIDVEIEIDADDSIGLMEKPFDPTKINIETKTPSLDTLIKRMDRESIEMNTSSYFQRKDDLWDRTKQSRLIESILIRFPLPAFFFDASDDDKWLVVDGLQRLSSIRNFCIEQEDRPKMKLTNLEFLSHLEGYTFEDLPENLQRVIEEAEVVIYKIMPGTPTDVKFNIFKRINTGGLILESQEIRHALFQGKPATFIAELARNKDFLKATQYRIKTHRMLDRDFANRFLGFYLLGYENYSPDLETFMSKAMAEINHLSDERLNNIKVNFSKSMKLAIDIFKEKAFRKIYKTHRRLPPINKALFDAIATQFAILSDSDRTKLKSNKTKFKNDLKESLAKNPDFFSAVSSSTGDKKRVLLRHNVVKELIQQNINV